MSRLNLTEDPTTELSLEELIPEYAENKSELDSYKKICDKENAQIKDLMLAQGLDEKDAGGYTAKRSVSVRETLNEAKLMEVLKKYNVPGIIKTKEYVDMDALEAYLYGADMLSTAFATDLEACKEKTEIVTLRVSVTKKKKEAN